MQNELMQSCDFGETFGCGGGAVEASLDTGRQALLGEWARMHHAIARLDCSIKSMDRAAVRRRRWAMVLVGVAMVVLFVLVPRLERLFAPAHAVQTAAPAKDWVDMVD